jgi:hypothetical protein
LLRKIRFKKERFTIGIVKLPIVKRSVPFLIIESFRKKEKTFFHHHYKNFIVSSKVIEKSSKDASIVKAFSAELFSGSTKETRSNGVKLNFRIKLLFLLFILLF